MIVTAFIHDGCYVYLWGIMLNSKVLHLFVMVIRFIYEVTGTFSHVVLRLFVFVHNICHV